MAGLIIPEAIDVAEDFNPAKIVVDSSANYANKKIEEGLHHVPIAKEIIDSKDFLTNKIGDIRKTGIDDLKAGKPGKAIEDVGDKVIDVPGQVEDKLSDKYNRKMKSFGFQDSATLEAQANELNNKGYNPSPEERNTIKKIAKRQLLLDTYAKEAKRITDDSKLKDSPEGKKRLKDLQQLGIDVIEGKSKHFPDSDESLDELHFDHETAFKEHFTRIPEDGKLSAHQRLLLRDKLSDAMDDYLETLNNKKKTNTDKLYINRVKKLKDSFDSTRNLKNPKTHTGDFYISDNGKISIRNQKYGRTGKIDEPLITHGSAKNILKDVINNADDEILSVSEKKRLLPSDDINILSKSDLKMKDKLDHNIREDFEKHGLSYGELTGDPFVDVDTIKDFKDDFNNRNKAFMEMEKKGKEPFPEPLKEKKVSTLPETSDIKTETKEGVTTLKPKEKEKVASTIQKTITNDDPFGTDEIIETPKEKFQGKGSTLNKTPKPIKASPPVVSETKGKTLKMMPRTLEGLQKQVLDLKAKVDNGEMTPEEFKIETKKILKNKLDRLFANKKLTIEEYKKAMEDLENSKIDDQTVFTIPALDAEIKPEPKLKIPKGKEPEETPDFDPEKKGTTKTVIDPITGKTLNELNDIFEKEGIDKDSIDESDKSTVWERLQDIANKPINAGKDLIEVFKDNKGKILGGIAGVSAGIAAGVPSMLSGSQKLLENLGTIGRTYEGGNLISKALTGKGIMENLLPAETKQLNQNIDEILRLFARQSNLEEQKKEVINIVNQPSSSVVENNESRRRLNNIEKAIEENKKLLTDITKRTETDAVVIKNRVDNRKKKEKAIKKAKEIKNEKLEKALSRGILNKSEPSPQPVINIINQSKFGTLRDYKKIY
jgi:hypothetical protein